MNLKSGFSESLLDVRQLLITLFLEEDFTKVCLQGSLFITGSTLILTKWTPYTPETDSPLVPCLITFKKLAIILFPVEALYKIAKLVVHPLRMDQTTKHKFVLTKSRVCVRWMLLLHHLPLFFVEACDFTHYVDVVYEEYPMFCSFCMKICHDINVFFLKKKTSLKISSKETSVGPYVGRDVAPGVALSNVDVAGYHGIGFHKVVRKNKRTSWAGL